jgi:hypothetical protein
MTAEILAGLNKGQRDEEHGLREVNMNIQSCVCNQEGKRPTERPKGT